MPKLPSLGAMALTVSLVAAPVLAPWAVAQSDATKPGANTPAAAVPVPAPAPTAGTATPQGTPSNDQATVASPANTLAVATVKLDSGWRASKMIGSIIYNEQNQAIGTIDDLIVTPDDKVAVAIISVGGFLGIGSKLIAVPYEQIRKANNKTMLTGATKDALNALPSFTYGRS